MLKRKQYLKSAFLFLLIGTLLTSNDRISISSKSLIIRNKEKVVYFFLHSCGCLNLFHTRTIVFCIIIILWFTLRTQVPPKRERGREACLLFYHWHYFLSRHLKYIIESKEKSNYFLKSNCRLIICLSIVFLQDLGWYDCVMCLVGNQ